MTATNQLGHGYRPIIHSHFGRFGPFVQMSFSRADNRCKFMQILAVPMDYRCHQFTSWNLL